MARFLSFPLTFPLGGGGGSGGTPGGTDTQVQYNNAGVFGGITGATTNGTALTLVAPVLGIPASGTLTNCTGLPAAGVVGTAAILGANTFTRLQTITQGTANEGIVASTGYSLTGSNSTNMIDLAGTWNTSGTPTALKIAITDTAHGATSYLMNLLSGAGGVTSRFSVDVGGNVIVGNQVLANGTIIGGAGVQVPNNQYVLWNGRTELSAPADGSLLIRNSAESTNLTITIPSTATFQQGAANAASPVAQTLQAQGSRSGTDSNVAGASYTIRPGASTGNATPGALILQSYVPVASGTGAQTATTTMTLNQGAVILPNSGGAATIGNAVLVGGTVTVSTTAATASAYIILTRKTSGGTLGTAITYTISAGVSFTITSDSALDTSTFTWLVLQGA